MPRADGNVSKFYNSMGWEAHGDETEDALRFDDLRDCASEYVSLCRLGSLVRSLKQGFSRKGRSTQPERNEHDLYFFTHYLEWWNRFEDIAKIDMHPWRSLAPQHQKKLIPDNLLARKMQGILYSMENRFPGFFVKNFQYCTIILRKL